MKQTPPQSSEEHNTSRSAFDFITEKKPLLLPAAILILGLALSGWIYVSLKTNARQLDEAHFQDWVSDAEQAVRERLRIYIDALQAGAAYRMNSTHVTRQEWRSYVDSTDIPNRYPGINGLGFIEPFYKDELAAYVDKVRQEEIPDFTIKNVPKVAHPPADAMGYMHYIITYIEPIEQNMQALGLDTASEGNRQAAGEDARDSGQPKMTRRITLVQDGQARPGFLIYQPMYTKSEKSLTSTEKRREAFRGWAYAPFITENFLAGVLGKRADRISFQAYDDAEMNPASFVYSTDQNYSAAGQNRFDAISQLNLAGQTFSFGWSRGPNYTRQATSSATIAGSSLAVGTLLLTLLVLNLQNTNRRANAIAKTKTSELRMANDALIKEVYLRKEAKQAADEAKAVAEEANSAKSDFLATMSHEIRTPMNSVIGFSELLANSNLNNEQRIWIDYILTSGNSLLHIINDILDISKIEANKFEIEAIAFSLDKVLSEVTNSFRALAAQKGVDVTYRSGAGLPRSVIGDPARLKQIVSNLVSNALKFTKAGKVTVTLDWSQQGENGEAIIRVEDTGIGIPKDKVELLFDKFTQADSSTTRQYGGTGLGLAICKHLTSLMGGEIRAESEEGNGTSVITSIPFVVEQHKSNQTRSPSGDEKNPVDAEALEVLLVDDNKMNLHLGATILKRLNCKVTLAENGAEALELLKSHRFPLVFLDCQMPVMDGYEATRQIREFEKLHKFDTLSADKPLQIVALTADASSETHKLCLEVGMNTFMTKPIQRNALKDIVQKHVRS